MVEISTSLLSVKGDNATRQIYDLEVAHTDYYHIDVMDGKFVENNTHERMKGYTNQIKQISNLPIDVHLMVEDIDAYLEEYIPFMPDRITFHYEACKNKEEVLEYINKIKESGIKVGISIKPNTKIEEIYEFLPLVHMVLIMTVEPGKGGQSLILDTLESAKTLRKYMQENSMDIDIEADGGIKVDNIDKIQEAGINIAVVGSAIINTEDYTKTIKELREKCSK